MDLIIFKKLDKELIKYIKESDSETRIGSAVCIAIIGSIEGLLNFIINYHHNNTINENSIRIIIEDGNTAMSKLFLDHMRSYNVNHPDKFSLHKDIKEYITSQNKNVDPTGLNLLTFLINKFIVDLIEGSILVKGMIGHKTLDSKCICDAARFMSRYEENTLAQYLVNNITKRVSQYYLQNKT